MVTACQVIGQTDNANEFLYNVKQVISYFLTPGHLVATHVGELFLPLQRHGR